MITMKRDNPIMATLSECMKAGKGWSTREEREERGSARVQERAGRSRALALCALILSGCASHSGHLLGKQLMADKSIAQHNQGVGESYLVGFPDVLAIQASGHPEISRTCVIGPDGRIDLKPTEGGTEPPQPDRLRVEGKSVGDVAAAIAGHTGLPGQDISVRILEYRSQPLFLIGQVVGWQRTVSYQGPETVLEVLQRVGGITPGAAPDEIYVVRAHVTEGPRPEVFHVDLNAILREQDQKTNIRLLPFDQVYVGESKRAKLLKSIPPCMRPMFFAMLGVRPIGPEGNGLRPRSGNLPPVSAPAKPLYLPAEKS